MAFGGFYSFNHKHSISFRTPFLRGATGDTPTSSAPQEKTYITVSLYSDLDARKYDVKVNFGQALAIPSGWLNSIANKKPGYQLEGWYYDAAFTKPYDMDTVIEKGNEDFSLYAKWVEN